MLFSLVACQDAAPISDEPLDQQELIENATTYFNQMLAGDFDTLYSDLPKGVQENTSVELPHD